MVAAKSRAMGQPGAWHAQTFREMRGGAADGAQGPFSPPASDMYQLPLDLHRIEAPSLENFVVGRNGEVLAQLRLLREGAALSGAALIYLWGEPGCGKSHLLQALVGAPRVLGPDSPPETFPIGAVPPSAPTPGGPPPGGHPTFAPAA